MIKLLPVTLLLLLAGSGCLSPQNNYLEARDFADLLKRDGLPVESIRVIPADPFRASSAVAIKVGDSEIGVYKYDITSDFQKKRLEKIEKSGRIHIAGIPYPVKVYGSFMFFGLEKNKHKRAILETIKSFK